MSSIKPNHKEVHTSWLQEQTEKEHLDIIKKSNENPDGPFHGNPKIRVSFVTSCAGIHCVSIMPDQCYIKDEFLDPHSHSKTTLHYEVVDKTDESATIKFEHNALILQVVKTEKGWLIKHIWTDIVRLLFKHSGRVIQTPEEFFAALTRYNMIMNSIMLDECKNRALPGLVDNCSTYWVTIESPIHIQDPDKTLFKQLWNAEHEKVRKPPLKVDGETISFAGSLFKFIIYLKHKQCRDVYKFSFNKADCYTLRFETTWKKSALVKAFGGEPNQRLKTFNTDSLYKAFLEGVQGFRGGFYKPLPTDHKMTKQEEFIFKLIVNERTDLTTRELVQLYCDGRLNKRRTSSMVKNINIALESVSKVALEDLFPEEAPRPSKNLRPRKERKNTKGECTGEFYEIEPTSISLLIDPVIREAYSKTSFIEYSSYQRSAIYDNTAKSAMPVPPNLKFNKTESTDED